MNAPSASLSKPRSTSIGVLLICRHRLAPPRCSVVALVTNADARPRPSCGRTGEHGARHGEVIEDRNADLVRHGRSSGAVAVGPWLVAGPHSVGAVGPGSRTPVAHHHDGARP